MASIRKSTAVLVLLALAATVLGGVISLACTNGEEKVGLKGWSMVGHDPRHTGRSSFRGVGEKPVIKWVSEADLFAVGKEGTVYATCYITDELAAFTDKGRLKWGLDIHIEFTPALGPKGTIYGTADRKLVAVSPVGAKEWEFKIAGEFAEIGSPPVVTSQGRIYFTVEDKGLVAISAEGEKKWIFKARINEHSTPAVGPNGTVYIVGHSEENYHLQNYLYAVTKEGKLKWKFPAGTGEEVDSTPSIDEEGTIYFGSGDNLYAVTPRGNWKWVYKTGGKVGDRGASPAIGPKETIIFGSNDAHYYAVSPEGATKWIINTQGDEVGDKMPVVDAGGDVYLCFRRPGGASLYGLQPNGTSKWKLFLDNCGLLAIGPDKNIYVEGIYSIGSCRPRAK